VDASLPDEVVGNVDESGATEGEESPLVAGADQGTNETSDDHDLVGQNDEEDGGDRNGSSQEQIGQKKRGAELKSVKISNTRQNSDFDATTTRKRMERLT
jgi:hypothetical protein